MAVGAEREDDAHRFFGSSSHGFSDASEAGTPRHPALITSATSSFEEQHRARVRKYTILMACRIPALIIAALTYSALDNWVVPLLIMTASVPLPWIAVLIANDRPPRGKDEPSRYPYRQARTALEPGNHPTVNG
ncbi:MAG TPA: DUF3099 domain-containing protein [Aldersonia sp.]